MDAEAAAQEVEERVLARELDGAGALGREPGAVVAIVVVRGRAGLLEGRRELLRDGEDHARVCSWDRGMAVSSRST